MNYEKARLLRAKRLGVLIRDARTAKRLSVRECAAAIGVTPAVLRAYERGDRAPSLPELEALAYHLDLPLDHFWGSETLTSAPASTKPLPLERLIHLRHRIIGLKLRQLREAKDLSLKALAQQAQIPAKRLRAYEYGEKPIPLPELETLAVLLDVPLQTFLDTEGPLGLWRQRQEAIQRFLELPPELQDFVSRPINRPYLELAQRLSEMNVDKLRAVAEGLLEITL